MLKKIKRHHRLMTDFGKALLDAFRRPNSIFLIFLSATITALGTIGFYFLENTNKGLFLGLLDAFYFCASTMTGVGYGDITPVTVLGKILSIGLMLVGTALYVCFTATIATALLEFENSVHKNFPEDN